MIRKTAKMANSSACFPDKESTFDEHSHGRAPRSFRDARHLQLRGENGTATFDVEPRAGAAGEAWFAAHNTGNHPLLVAEEDGKVLGYASLSPYRDFDAYLQTVELSVYVAPESRGRGIASALMEAVLRLAREDAGTHTVVSVIAGGNAASVRLHEKFGFTYSGALHEVGLKFGRYLDIVNYELRVG